MGRFSEAIYKKIIGDAKQQRFQGFRPGTIPPHLQPTYKAFAMDECARETVLEAMQQNNIRPFTDARSEFKIESICVPPPKQKGGKKKKGGRKNKDAEAAVVEEPEPEPQWKTYENMKEAIDAGWMVSSRIVVAFCMLGDHNAYHSVVLNSLDKASALLLQM